MDFMEELDAVYTYGWNHKGRHDYDPRGTDAWCNVNRMYNDERRERENTVAMCKQLQEEIERLRHALRMIAGEVPCLDMNMGNVDIAVAALRGEEQTNG